MPTIIQDGEVLSNLRKFESHCPESERKIVFLIFLEVSNKTTYILSSYREGKINMLTPKDAFSLILKAI